MTVAGFPGEMAAVPSPAVLETRTEIPGEVPEDNDSTSDDAESGEVHKCKHEKKSRGCCHSCKKVVERKLKAIAYGHAQNYRRAWFRTYLTKYINKIGKLARHEGNTKVHSWVCGNVEALVHSLTNVLCSEEVAETQSYLFLASNKSFLTPRKDRIKDVLRRLGGSEPTEAITQVVDAIVEFAFSLRKALNASTSVAKTKIQEYWADRIPPMLLLGGCLLTVQLIFSDFSEIKDYVALGVTLCAFATGFFMVYLRLPHAVDGATKQKASDEYVAHKDEISRLIAAVSGGNAQSRRDDNVQETFGMLSDVIERTWQN